MDPLSGQTIVLGVTGSIAAYKAAELTSRLSQRGAHVHVVLTAHAAHFVGPLTFRTLSGNPVLGDMFAAPEQWELAHVSLADRADVVVVAPATANAIARLAAGLADDLLTSLVLATRAPVLVVPAMNVHMYEHPATQANLQRLQALGYHLLEPASGMLACGYEGKGRLPDTPDILTAIEQLLARARDMQGLRVVVTAGPTREWLDPVRFLSNPSSGKMGYALAEEAVARGAEVTLVTGPTGLPEPRGVSVVKVETAAEMLEATVAAARQADMVIGAAAPVDWRPAARTQRKLKKGEGPPEIKLVANPDILGTLGRNKGRRVLVGFAAETQHLIANAREKLTAKGLDLVVANDVTTPGAGFAADTNQVTLVAPGLEPQPLPLLPKREVAKRILDSALGILQQRRGKEP